MQATGYTYGSHFHIEDIEKKRKPRDMCGLPGMQKYKAVLIFAR